MAKGAVLSRALENILQSEPVPVFMAGSDSALGHLTLHVSASDKADGLKRRTSEALRAQGLDVSVTVRSYREKALTRARSLDEVVRPFRHEKYIFDPTATVGRAVVVLDAVVAARNELGAVLSGAYLDPVNRIIYAVIDNADRSQADRVAETLLKAIDTATARTGSEFNRPPLTVLVVTMLPMRPLVAVDRASYRRRPVVVGSSLRGWRAAAAGLAAAVGIGAASVAVAQQPAVSGLNGKLDIRGGYARYDAQDVDGLAGFVTGSIAAPLGTSFGVQVDGAVGITDGVFYWGAGGHLFWRDPSRGLLGVFGQTSEVRGGNLYRAGVEGDYYLSRVSLGGYAGYQIGQDSRRVHVDDGIIAGVNLKFYTTDNFMLRLGGGIEHTSVYGRAGFEYQPGFAALPGLSIFADGGIGSDKHSYALAGIRFYFGANKSLIRRHREDDPDLLPIGEIQKFERKRRPSSVSNYAPSDRRLKTDIAPLGELDSGIGIYQFRYIWGGPTYVGVMAQDVLSKIPEAVRLGDDGFYSVDYNKVGMTMMTIEQWRAQSHIGAGI